MPIILGFCTVVPQQSTLEMVCDATNYDDLKSLPEEVRDFLERVSFDAAVVKYFCFPDDSHQLYVESMQYPDS